MGEKGNLAIDDPLLALDAIPLDAIKSSPETVGAWLDTYLKFREARDASSEASEAAQGVVADAAEAEAAEVAKVAEAALPRADGPGSTTGI